MPRPGARSHSGARVRRGDFLIVRGMIALAIGSAVGPYLLPLVGLLAEVLRMRTALGAEVAGLV
jgi:hypothetical protein